MKKLVFTSLALILSCCFSINLFAQTTVNLEATADTYLRQSNASYNNGGNTTVSQSPNTSSRRNSLYLWSLASIPADAVVTAASITFYVTDASTYDFSLYKMRRAWIEGTNTDASGTGASWSYYGAGSGSWGTAGAMSTSTDRYNTDLWDATGSTFGSTGSVTISLNTSGIAAIQDWVTTSSNNYGLTIQYSGTGTTSDYWDVSSSEATTVANRPNLNITYNVSTSPTITITGSLSPFTSAVGIPSSEQSYLVAGTNLTDNLVITAPVDFQISTTQGSGFTSSIPLAPVSGIVSSTTIYVRLNPSTSTTYSANITNTSTGATEKDIAVTGTSVPAINSTSSMSSFNCKTGSTSTEQSYTVSGINLTGDVLIAAPTDFQLSTTSGSGFASSLTLLQTDGIVVPTIIYVRFNRQTDGTSSGDIVHSSGSATQNTVVSGTASTPVTGWTAYNDAAWSSGQPGTNITQLSIYNNKSGTLVDYNTNTSTMVIAAFTLSTPSVDGTDFQVTTAGAAGTSGSDAYNTFNGIVSTAGVVNGMGSYSGWWIDLTLSGLDPTKMYTFAGTTIRNSSSYTTRNTTFILSGDDDASNASSSGVIVVDNHTIAFNTGYNSSGNIVKWTGINPGSDGTIVIRSRASSTSEISGSTSNSYGISAFMVKEEGPTITTTGTLTPFISPVGTPSSAQEYTINGTKLTDNINISAPAGFEISTDGSNYSSGLTLTQSGGSVSATTIHVRLNSSSAGTFSGNITNTSTDATTKDIAVSGTVSFYYTLTIDAGSNGTVELNPTGGSYSSGTIVTVTAAGNTGYLFGSWSGDLSGSTNPTSITMDGNKSVTAAFVPGISTAVNIEASEDTYISSANTTNNYGGVDLFKVTNNSSSNKRGALLKWDLTSIPSGAVVTNVSMTVYVSTSSTQAYNLYNMRRSWVEGTTTPGATSSTSANWNTWDGSSSWGTLGAASISADRYDVNLWGAGINSFSSTGNKTFSFNSDGISVVQGWIDGTATNYGVTMQSYSTTSGSDDLQISSSENTANTGPTLNITYSILTGTTYTLALTHDENGSVSLSPTGGVYNAGTSVTLTPLPNSGYKFSTWSGTNAGEPSDNGNGTWSLLMNGNKSISANFSLSTINQAPDQPVLVQPPDNSIDISLSPSLQVSVSDPNPADNLDVSFYGRASGTSSGEDFSIVLIPDPQNLATSYPTIYNSETQWIVDNKTTSNIVFATALGDLVNTSSSSTEYSRADAAFDILDAGNVPYSVSPGNHDMAMGTTLWPTYFGSSRFSGKSWYGGSLDDYNTYSLFTASGMDFIIINLQYSPGTTQLNWADALLKANTGRRAIVVQHDILNINDSWVNQASYTALKDNPNLFLMLCGHMHSSSDGAGYRAEPGDDGHTIHIVMADYQDFTGIGYIRILRFSPTDDMIYMTTYAPNNSASITTSPDQMNLTYDLVNGTSSAYTLIGTVNDVSNGDNGSISWPGRANNTEYEWYTSVSDGTESVTGPTWSFTTGAPANYTLTTSTDGNGSVTLNPPGGSYPSDTPVTLTPTPNTGYQFSSWTGANASDISENGGIYTIVINTDKAITANFTQIEYTLTVNNSGNGSVTKNPDQVTYHYGDIITLTASPGTGWSFAGWTSDLTGTVNPSQITIDGNKTVIAAFSHIEYTLTTSTIGNGSVTKNPDQVTYHYGDIVTLTASPGTGWSFAGWTSDLTGTVNPSQITIDGNKTVIAAFSHIEYTLTTSTIGNGSVTKNPDQVTYHYGDIVTLTASPGTGWSFAGWTSDLTGTVNPSQITIDGNKTVIAAFSHIEYTLTTSTIGNGSVTKNPDQVTYHYGDIVTLTASPESGWSFAGWTSELTGTVNPSQITIDGNKTVIAAFSQIEYTLTTSTIGNGSVTKNPDQVTYHYGDIVTLTASPGTGWSFAGWTSDITGTVNPSQITIDGNKTVIAAFSQIEYTLTTSTIGNGSVTKNPDQVTYHYGDIVTLTASPESGWSFAGWAGNLTGTVNPSQITIDGNKTITVTFTLISLSQDISLLNGWNIFSLYITPENTNMLQVLKPLIDAGVLIKVQDETGASVEFISSNWNNNIGNWSNTEGYKIRINSSSSLTIPGIPFSLPVNIDLLSGWNIISYPVSNSGDAMQILNTLIESGNLIKVQDEAGAAIEKLSGTSIWLNNIGNFDPGKGYKVRVNGNSVLSIHQSGSKSKGSFKINSTDPATEFYKPIWSGNGFDQMNIYLSEISDGESGLKPGDEIGIFDGSNCVGAGLIKSAGEKFYSFVLSADDPTTIETDGFVKGHPLSFKVWRPTNNSETTIDKFEFYSGSSKVFEPMGSAALKINTSVLGLNDYDITTSLGNNYPNPFRYETTIPYKVGAETSVDITIYNMQGLKLNTLVHSTLQSGNYIVKWKLTDEKNQRILPGIYYCKMIAGNKVFVKNVIVY